MSACLGGRVGWLISCFSYEAPESHEHHEKWVWAKGEEDTFRRGCRRGKRERGSRLSLPEVVRAGQ